MRFKKRPQLPGAGRTRAGHYHGSHTPTSPGAILSYQTNPPAVYIAVLIRLPLLKSFSNHGVVSMKIFSKNFSFIGKKYQLFLQLFPTTLLCCFFYNLLDDIFSLGEILIKIKVSPPVVPFHVITSPYSYFEEI